jgi:hypothetical protein
MERVALRENLSCQKGQTVLEYLLMLLVMVSIITSLLAYVKTKYLGDATKCDKPAFSKTLLCKINSLIEPQGGGKKFQFYPFKK